MDIGYCEESAGIWVPGRINTIIGLDRHNNWVDI